MHVSRRALLSFVLTVLAALLLLAPSPRAQVEAFDWTFQGCAELVGPRLVLKLCGPDCSPAETSEAIGLTLQPGTLTVNLDWVVKGNNKFTELFVSTSADELVYSITTTPWCAPPPCTGSVTGITMHLDAGQSAKFRLYNGEVGCDWDVGGTVCTFRDFVFVPDTGFFPGSGFLDGRLLAEVHGTSSAKGIGAAVAFVGDIDGDGHDDWVTASTDGTGKVRFVSGATAETLFEVSYPGACCGQIAPVGDVNGDGFTDLLLGVRDNAPGPARLISGLTGLTLLTVAKPLEPQFAHAVSAAGDRNGDGVPDLLIGSPGAVVTGAGSGAATVYSGVNGAPLLQITGQPGDYVGDAVADVGDVDGDGYHDYAVSAPGDTTGPSKGMIRLHSGWDAALLASLPGPVDASVNTYYRRVAAAGDLDADGVGDVVVGLPGAGTGGPLSGDVQAFSGATGALLFDVPGEAAYLNLGESVAAYGDWNGDGYDDVLVGAQGSVLHDGRMRVLSGFNGAVLQQIGLNVPLKGFGGDLGDACASGGDVDGDGRDDVLVGHAWWFLTPGASLGRVLVFSGDPADYQPPALAPSGSLLPGSPFTLGISGCDPFAPAAIFVGASLLQAPFKGGTLVPYPNVFLPLALNGAGAASLATTWPAGLPAGTPLWAQVWAVDRDDGPLGYVASLSLLMVTP